MILTAECDEDAAFLALIYRVTYSVCCKKTNGNRLELYRFLLSRVDDKESFPEL